MSYNACTGNGPPVIWLGFLDTYRTLCVAPNQEIRSIFDELRSFSSSSVISSMFYPDASLAFSAELQRTSHSRMDRSRFKSCPRIPRAGFWIKGKPHSRLDRLLYRCFTCSSATTCDIR